MKKLWFLLALPVLLLAIYAAMPSGDGGPPDRPGNDAWYASDDRPAAGSLPQESSSPAASSLSGERSSMAAQRSEVDDPHAVISNSPPGSSTAPPAPLLPAGAVVEKFLSSLTGEAMEQNPSLPNPAKVMHQQFENEKTDVNWSSNLEPELQGYLKSHFDPDRVEIVNVECHSTMCEVQAVASPVPGMEQEWQDTIFSMPKQAWWQSYGLDEPNNTMALTSDGRYVFVAFLTRAQQPK